MQATPSPKFPKPTPPPLKNYPHQRPLLIPLPLPKHIPKFLERAPVQLRVLPQIRRQEPICVAHRHERSFQRVLERLRRACGGGVHVLDAGELEEALDGGGGDESGAAGGGDELLRCVYQPTSPNNPMRHFPSPLSCSLDGSSG